MSSTTGTVTSSGIEVGWNGLFRNISDTRGDVQSLTAIVSVWDGEIDLLGARHSSSILRIQRLGTVALVSVLAATVGISIGRSETPVLLSPHSETKELHLEIPSVFQSLTLHVPAGSTAGSHPLSESTLEEVDSRDDVAKTAATLGVTMGDLAKAANVSRATLFNARAANASPRASTASGVARVVRLVESARSLLGEVLAQRWFAEGMPSRAERLVAGDASVYSELSALLTRRPLLERTRRSETDGGFVADLKQDEPVQRPQQAWYPD